MKTRSNILRKLYVFVDNHILIYLDLLWDTYCRKLEAFQSFPQVSFGRTWCKFVHPSNIGLEPNQILLSNVFWHTTYSSKEHFKNYFYEIFWQFLKLKYWDWFWRYKYISDLGIICNHLSSDFGKFKCHHIVLSN